MSFNVLNRKVHYWASFIVALPLLAIIATGILLQVKKQSTWVQPAEQAGTGTVPQITLDDIFAATRLAPDMNVTSWDDIDRLDVRPGKGIVKVMLNSGWEVQVDLGTGAVLQTAYRRSDLIESIHDGSFFAGDWTKLGLFLPTGITLLLLWLGGMWMWWVPYAAKRRVRRRREVARPSRAANVAMALTLGATAACSSQAPPADATADMPVPQQVLTEVRPPYTPLLGHWDIDTSGPSATITGDATQWNGEAPGNVEATATTLFGAAPPELLANLQSPGAFPIAISNEVERFSDGTLSVEFNLIGGETDQIAGLMFDVKPTGEYYYVRYNTRDDDIALWRFREGERENLAHGEGRRRLPFDTWHPLVLTVTGRQLSASAAGDLTIEYTLDAPVSGRVGVWTKRDSITAFRDLRVQ